MADTVVILNKLFLALQNVRFYPPTHTLVQESVTTLYKLLQNALASDKEFSFGFVEQKLIANGKPVDAEPAQTQGLARHFEILQIDHITIKPGLTPAELCAFLECLSIKPEQLLASGGMKKALTDRGLKYIQANDVIYGRISKKKTQLVDIVTPPLPRVARDKTKEKTKDKKEEADTGEDFIKALRMAESQVPATPPPRHRRRRRHQCSPRKKSRNS